MINIELEKFSGPLDLLLKMIEKEEMDITQISLIKITDQYLKYISQKNISMDEISDFLVVASRLILIKSRALLPNFNEAEDEETEEFRQQLKMYKEFLDALEIIEASIKEQNIMLERASSDSKLEIVKFLPPKILEKNDLYQSFNNLINNLSKQLEPKIEEKTIEREIHIEDKILEIRQIVLEKIKVDFNKILIKAESKTEIVVIFLGLLELMKQRYVSVNQNDLFGEIQIKANKVNKANKV